MNIKTKYYKEDGKRYRKYENEYIEYFIDYYNSINLVTTDILTKSSVYIKHSSGNNTSNLIKNDILFIIKYMRENQ